MGKAVAGSTRGLFRPRLIADWQVTVLLDRLLVRLALVTKPQVTGTGPEGNREPNRKPPAQGRRGIGIVADESLKLFPGRS